MWRVIKRRVASVPSFAWRISFAMLVGYLLATLPQIILDSNFTSHVAFPPRTYPWAWLVGPISTVVLVATLFVAAKPLSQRSFGCIILPFVVCAVVSIPIFAPELPHGNLVFVTGAWSAIALVAAWVHYAPITDPSKHSPRPSVAAQLEFAKEQAGIWRTVGLGLAASYLAFLIGFAPQLNTFSANIVQAKRDLFLFSAYTSIEVMLVSIFVLVGPVFELATKTLASNTVLLGIREDT